MNIPVGTFLRERKPRFFEGLDAPDIRTILAAGTQQRFPANSVIVSQGYPAGHLHLLLTGRARRFFLTEDGEKVVLLRVPPRDIFGEAALLARPVDYLLSAEAMTNSTTTGLEPRHNPRSVRAHSEVDGKRFASLFRLSGSLSGRSRLSDLQFRSAAACSRTCTPRRRESVRRSQEESNSTSGMRNWPTRPTFLRSLRAAC